jgi:hypothetical protein
MLDKRDPHYALGFEHGQAGVERYVFQDCENQRRYLIGYEHGQPVVGRRTASESLSAFEQLAKQMQHQQQSRFRQSIWGGNGTVFPGKP